MHCLQHQPIQWSELAREMKWAPCSTSSTLRFARVQSCHFEQHFWSSEKRRDWFATVSVSRLPVAVPLESQHMLQQLCKATALVLFIQKKYLHWKITIVQKFKSHGYCTSQNSSQGEFFVLILRSWNFTEWFLSLKVDMKWTKNHGKWTVGRCWISRNKEAKLSFSRTDRSWVKRRITTKLTAISNV